MGWRIATVVGPTVPMFTIDPDAPRSPWLGMTLALAGAAFFATKGIVIKLALLQGVDPLTTYAWRTLVATPIFLSVGLLGWRQRRKSEVPTLDAMSVAQVMALGLFGYYLFGLLDFLSLEYISAQFNRLVLLTYPFLVVLFGAVLFRRRITLPMMVGQVLCYLGIALIFWRDFSSEGPDVMVGAALVLAAAVIYAGYLVIAKPLIDKLGAQLFTSIAMSSAGPAALVHFLLTHPVTDLAVPAPALPLMLAIGTLSTVLPAYCIAGAIRLIGSERTAASSNFTVVTTTVLAIVLLGEPFTLWHFAGTALVLGGVWVSTLRASAAGTVRREDRGNP